MPAPRTHTGSKSLAEVKERLDEVAAELEDLHWRRIGLTRWLTIFARQLASVEDQALLEDVTESLYDDGELFYFEAWLPEQRVEELHAYTKEAGLLLQVRPPEDDEMPPTLLENRPAWSGGESLVQFYTTPAYDMWDPSTSIFLSFVIFFAMIISDAGYGLLLGLIWLIGHRRFSCTSPGLCRLFGAMVAATIIYGVMVGSYFGVAPEPHSLPARFKLLEVRNKEQMMLLSIAIGVGHLITANSGNLLGAALQALSATVGLDAGPGRRFCLVAGRGDYCRCRPVGQRRPGGGGNGRPLCPAVQQHQAPGALAGSAPAPDGRSCRPHRLFKGLWRCLELSAPLCPGAGQRPAGRYL